MPGAVDQDAVRPGLTDTAGLRRCPARRPVDAGAGPGHRRGGGGRPHRQPGRLRRPRRRQGQHRLGVRRTTGHPPARRHRHAGPGRAPDFAGRTALPATACGRLRGARPAGPPPTVPRPAPQTAERIVSSNGGFVVAGQRVQVGRTWARQVVTGHLDDTVIQVFHGNKRRSSMASFTEVSVSARESRGRAIARGRPERASRSRDHACGSSSFPEP